jgi:hypothetical protein
MGKLAGYKTYIVAGVAVITAVAGYLTGELSAVAAGQAVLTAVLGATIRHGVTTGA